MRNLIRIISLIGIALLALSNIVGIGYFLYLWGALSMAFGMAAWTAFKVWISIMAVGFTLFIGGGVLSQR